MSTPRKLALPAVAVLAALTFLVGACSSDDSSDGKKTTTTEKSDKGSDSGTDDGDQSTTTMSDGDFEKSMDTARNSLKEAGDDPCKVMQTFQSVGASIGEPSSPAQREQATMLAVDFYKALAESAPDDLSAEADQVRTSVEAIVKEGKESNWSEEFFNSPKAVSDEKFNEATTKILESFTQKCAPESTTTAP